MRNAMRYGKYARRRGSGMPGRGLRGRDLRSDDGDHAADESREDEKDCHGGHGGNAKKQLPVGADRVCKSDRESGQRSMGQKSGQRVGRAAWTEWGWQMGSRSYGFSFFRRWGFYGCRGPRSLRTVGTAGVRVEAGLARALSFRRAASSTRCRILPVECAGRNRRG